MYSCNVIAVLPIPAAVAASDSAVLVAPFALARLSLP